MPGVDAPPSPVVEVQPVVVNLAEGILKSLEHIQFFGVEIFAF